MTVCNRLLRALALALLALLAVTGAAVAREEIRSFASTTTLATNGAVDVVETIVVNAEGDQIRHGIFRDIPTVEINPDKSRQRSDLRVVAVQRDGAAEPYSVEDIGNGYKRIRIGDADTYVATGVHTYTVHYTMSRMVRYFADHDELYWNATGNYWVFPILSATATLNLPAGAVAGQTVGYTGAPGSLAQDVTVTRNSDTSVTFRANGTLAPGEGMSVAVAFQKGVVPEPQGLTAAGYWLSDHRDLVFPTLAVLLVLLYNYFAWSSVGRDPKKGTIIPLFHPPQKMAPPLVHYIDHMGFARSGWVALTSAIFDLGVRGLVTIDGTGKGTTITRTEQQPEALPAGERGIFDFIDARGSVSIDKTDGPKLNEKRRELVAEIQRANRETYFKNNIPYTVGGGVLALAMLGALVWLDILEPFLLIVAVVVAVVVGVFISIFTRGGGGLVGRLIGLVWVIIVGANVLGSGASFATGSLFGPGLIAAISIVAIEIVFAILMRAPTIQGRKLMDQIDGFKMYLETAEKNRLNYVDKGEPQMTVKRFEAILPFAIALGVEKPWSERFEADLSRNAVPDAVGGVYAPLWYTGRDWGRSSSGFSNAVSSVATGMSAAMIAAQPSSSSGSGFGGGGGSGGGGGGGGGGGW